MNIVFLSGLVALVLLVPTLVHHYLVRLPIAPNCPACHAITSSVSTRSVPSRLFPALAQTAVRRCASCGWKGRMRWRWAPGAARGSL